MFLSAKTRTFLGRKNNKLRKQGLIPAVLYGPGIESINIFLDQKEFEMVYKTAGKTSMIELKIEGESAPRNILIYNFEKHPLTFKLIHVDLYQTTMSRKTRISVPVKYIGESEAVKNLGGILVKNLYEIEVEAMLKDLPREVVVDISDLKTLESSIKIKNLNLPAGVKIINLSDDDIIALVIAPTQEPEEVKKEEIVDVSAVKIETEEKKKERQEKAEIKKTEKEAPAT